MQRFHRYLTALTAILLAFSFGCASPKSDRGSDKAGSSEARKSRMRLPGAPSPKKVATTKTAAQDEARTGTIATAPDSKTYRLRKDDAIIIFFRGIPNERELNLNLDEHGTVNLPYLQPVKAEGLTSSELEQVIHDAYVPDYYKQLTVNILVPSQSYYVRGEVRQPGRYPIVRGGITLLQAIATAGGFTDYANPKYVKIVRNEESDEFNLKDIEKNPEEDVAVIAGDYIVVPRSRF